MSTTGHTEMWAVYRDDGVLIRGPYDNQQLAEASARGLNACATLGNPSSYESREFITDDEVSK